MKNKSLIPNAGVGLFTFDHEKDGNDIVFKKNDFICPPYAGEIINTETLADNNYMNNYDDKTAPYTVPVKYKYSEAAGRISCKS